MATRESVIPPFVIGVMGDNSDMMLDIGSAGSFLVAHNATGEGEQLIAELVEQAEQDINLNLIILDQGNCLNVKNPETIVLTDDFEILNFARQTSDDVASDVCGDYEWASDPHFKPTLVIIPALDRLTSTAEGLAAYIAVLRFVADGPPKGVFVAAALDMNSTARDSLEINKYSTRIAVGEVDTSEQAEIFDGWSNNSLYQHCGVIYGSISSSPQIFFLRYREPRGG